MHWACEMMFGKNSEDILGIFYRENSKIRKRFKDITDLKKG